MSPLNYILLVSCHPRTKSWGRHWPCDRIVRMPWNSEIHQVVTQSVTAAVHEKVFLEGAAMAIATCRCRQPMQYHSRLCTSIVTAAESATDPSEKIQIARRARIKIGDIHRS